MAVLVEAISVVVQVAAIERSWPGGWLAFRESVPNKTLCADGELVRVGFMSPDDSRDYIEGLAAHGLVHLDEGSAVDLVVVDQLRGPTTACTWIEYGHVNTGSAKEYRVAACRLVGSSLAQVLLPDGWRYESSLSSTYGFTPVEAREKSLEFLRHANGLDVYFNRLTGEEVFIGRTSKS